MKISRTLFRGMRTAIMACVVLFGLGWTCLNAAWAEDATVSIDNFTFQPPTTVVKVGTTVKWTNHDDIPHTVVSAGKFRSKPLDTGDSYSFTFTSAGDYPYFCSLHPHMTGMIRVE